MFASICESTTQYNRNYLFPPGSSPVTLVKPPCAFDLGFFYSHHLDLPTGYPRVFILPIMNVENHAINAILIYPSNSDMYKDLIFLAFLKWVDTNVQPFQIAIPYHPSTDPGMISTQYDPLYHSVYL
ncbi:hypothetical protein DSO57_1003967 [Entomophthora muscae]|uniref:Uncharacterized protein n=1 Tax=Entomophthora muscae TaxID=34485 RepID=A0ACC2TW40_9FUNG|nr:hypothetical protein DSO57_1003967 [Entomophthora muscae]